MLIDRIIFHVQPKDYSKQLEAQKREMGRSYKLHPKHDPLDFPWQYEEWKLQKIEENRGIKH